MAGTKRHIDQVLKNKLGNHQASITEADWDAFDAFQQKKKPSRKGLFYLGAAALFIALLSTLLFLNRNTSVDSPKAANQPRNPAPQTEQGNQLATKPSLSEKESVSNPTEESEINANNNEEETSANTAQSTDHSSPGNTLPSADNETGADIPSTTPPSTQVLGTQNIESTPAAIERNEEVKLSRIAPRVLRIPASQLGRFEHAYIAAYAPKEDKDSNKNLLKFVKKLPPMGPCIAVGLVYGFGTPQLSLTPGDPEQEHKDYAATEKGTSSRSNVFRFFGQYEYRIKAGLEFGAGLQFSSVTQVRKYSFENRNIPFIGPDDKILLYIRIPSNQSVDPTVFESRQNIYSATVPLTVGYAHAIGSKLRIGARVQGNMGLNWSKAYTNLNPKSLAETPSAGNSNPLNIGYGGGVYGEYFYLSKWSLRGSFDWTAQNKQYKSGNSYNLQNRFYEIRFSLVRYL